MKKNVTMLPEDYQFNSSEFALFLSVMKNPKAYRNVLSIIMEEPDIQIKEVKVEQVVLNKSGKRAIHLEYEIQNASIYSNYIYNAGRYLWKRFGEIYIYRTMRRSCGLEARRWNYENIFEYDK